MPQVIGYEMDVTKLLELPSSAAAPADAPLEFEATRFLQWLSNTPDLGKATKRAYLTDFGQFLEAMAPLGPLHMADLEERHVETWKSSMNGLEPATIRRKLVALSVFFDWARMQRLITVNPVEFVKKPKKARKVKSAVTLAHYQLLAAACKTKRDRAMLGCLYWAGLRRHEVVDLNIGSADLDNMSILVRGKGEKERLVPMARNLRTLLVDYLSTRPGASYGEPLFLSQDGVRASDKVLQAWFERLLERAGLGEHGYTLHSCRRGISSLMHDEDIPLLSIQAFLGHEDPKTTATYIQGAAGKLRERMDANPIFGQESEDEPHSSADLEAMGAKMDRVENMLAILLERSSAGLEDGVYPLHEAL